MLIHNIHRNDFIDVLRASLIKMVLFPRLNWCVVHNLVPTLSLNIAMILKLDIHTYMYLCILATKLEKVY